MKMKQVISLFCAAALSVSLVGCASNQTGDTAGSSAPSAPSASGTPSASPSQSVTTVRIAAGDTMKQELLEAIQPDFEAMGYKLEISLVEDPIASNTAMVEGSIDANFIQHVAYMTLYNQEHDATLVAEGPAIYYPRFGIYSEKITSLDEITDGMMVGIPRDATNLSRALRFLEAEGLITLEEGKDVNTYMTLDVVDNPHNLQFTEMDSAGIPLALPDLGFGVCYPIQMKDAGKDYENPLAFDPAEIGQEYGIVLTVREEDKDAQWAKDLQTCMSSGKARDIVVEYFGTASIHIFDYSQD